LGSDWIGHEALQGAILPRLGRGLGETSRGSLKRRTHHVEWRSKNDRPGSSPQEKAGDIKMEDRNERKKPIPGKLERGDRQVNKLYNLQH